MTAGGSGIGLAIARSFVRQGASVAICDVDAAAIERIRSEEGVYAGVVDVADEQRVTAFASQVEREFGGIDVLVNNAGIAGGSAPIASLSSADWSRSFTVNVSAAFFFLRAVVPGMIERGGGAVINISTGSVATLPVNRLDYIASKSAIEGMTRGAARELGPAQIRVNAIRPGMVEGPRMRGILQSQAARDGLSFDEVEASFLSYVSMHSKIEPEEIGALAVFLASADARHVTGQVIAVDGNVEWEA